MSSTRLLRLWRCGGWRRFVDRVQQYARKLRCRGWTVEPEDRRRPRARRSPKPPASCSSSRGSKRPRSPRSPPVPASAARASSTTSRRRATSSGAPSMSDWMPRRSVSTASDGASVPDILRGDRLARLRSRQPRARRRERRRDGTRGRARPRARPAARPRSRAAAAERLRRDGLRGSTRRSSAPRAAGAVLAAV